MLMKILPTVLMSIILAACSNSNSSIQTTDAIKSQILKEIPGLNKIDAVNSSPINGIYEVVVGRKVFYATSDGKYLFFGNIVDPKNGKSITEERVTQLSKIDPSLLPLNLAIKDVNGSGRRVLYVFSDPECPYCQMLERQVVPFLKDTTIYTFLFPLPTHINAKPDAQKIWCSSNRTKTWTSWMRNKTPLPSNMSCDTSELGKIDKIGRDIVQVEATPTLILSNGQILLGAVPPEQLLEQMDKAAVK